MKNINYQLQYSENKVNLPNNLGFGQYFTNHILEMDYAPELGWHNVTIKTLDNLSLHPATMFFHYGQAIFEGLKAFKQESGEIVIFRPDKHFERFNKSAKRLCMPEVEIDFVIEALKELIAIEKEWVPSRHGEALYIRPLMFGTDPVLGVKPSQNYKFVIILSPVGSYYGGGISSPIKILVQDEYVRTVRKGLGECKTLGNYAASLLASEKASDEGYNQVLWLDAIELKYIEEVGAMNIFVQFDDEIVTPKLTGGILHGITRLSVLHILRELGYNVSERLLSINEVIEKYKSGKLTGIFGTGTAAIISPVGELKYKNVVMNVNNNLPSQLTKDLYKEITSIQYGTSLDKYGWLTYVNTEIAVF